MADVLIAFGGPGHPTPAELRALLTNNEEFGDDRRGAGVLESPRDKFEHAYLAQLDHVGDTGDLVPVGEVIGYYQMEIRRIRRITGGDAERVIGLGAPPKSPREWG